jgi:hypothetical protein
LRDLLDATQARYRDELHQPHPPAFLLYIDQGEELYVRAAERDRRRFSKLLADALKEDTRLRAMMSMRADFIGEFHQDQSLYDVHQQIDIPPLREAQLREVVSKPPEVLSARFEAPDLIDAITRQAARDVGALPVLSYTLDDMWSAMVHRDDGVLRLAPQHIALGGVLVDHAENFLSKHRDAEAAVRRIFTLRCATVLEGGEPTRRRAPHSEFSAEEWRLVCELANFPNRLLVTARAEAGEIYAEVAHESIFQHWQKLREWVAAERKFLSWRKLFEDMRKRWEGESIESKDAALLRGVHLQDAQKWLEERGTEFSTRDKEFVSLSRECYEKEEAWLASKARWRDAEQALRKEVAQTIHGLIGSVKRTIRWPP